MVLVLLSLAFFTVKLTVYFPALLYVCTGLFCVEVVPSPKVHFHDVGTPVLLSVKLTFSGLFPEVGDVEKAATGIFSFSRVRVYMLLFPPLSDQKAIFLPSGLHTGNESDAESDVTCTLFFPSASITHISSLPVLSDKNTILLPSGEKIGELSFAESEVS